MNVVKKEPEISLEERTAFQKKYTGFLTNTMLGYLVGVKRSMMPYLRLEPEGEECYTDHKTVVLGLADEDVSTVKELFAFCKYVLGHECQHVLSTPNKPWLFGITAGTKIIINEFRKGYGLTEISTMTLDEAPRIIAKMMKDGYAMPPLQTITSVVHYILNALEDGRIERHRSAEWPAFAKLVRYFRGKMWMRLVLEDKKDAAGKLSAEDEFALYTTEVLNLSTCHIHSKGYWSLYSTTAYHKTVMEMTQHITKAVYSPLCKGCMMEGIEIIKILAPFYVKSFEESPMADIAKLISKLMQGAGTPMPGGEGFNSLPEKMEEAASGNGENPFGTSDLGEPEIAKDDEDNEVVTGNVGEAPEKPAGQRKSGSGKDGDKSDKDGDEASAGGKSDKNGKDGDKDKSMSDGDNAGDKSGESGDKGKDEKEGKEGKNGKDGKDGSDNSDNSDNNSKNSGQSDEDDRRAKNHKGQFADGEAEAVSLDADADISSILEESVKSADSSFREDLKRVDENIRQTVTEEKKNREMAKDVFDPTSTAETAAAAKSIPFVEVQRRYKINQELPPWLDTRGKRLAGDMQKLVRNKKTGYYCGQTHGKVDASRLYCLPLGEGSCFKKQQQPDKTSACAYILQDNSGSMGDGEGSTRMFASEATAIIEAGFKDIMPLKIVAFDERRGHIVHEVIKNWGDNTRLNSSYNFYVNGESGSGNCDYDDIVIATDELNRRTEKEKILIVLSDGYPCSGGKCICGSATDSVRAAVNRARQLGIRVVGIYMASEICQSNIDVYKSMYGEEAICVELDDIADKLVAVMRGWFH